MRKYYCFIILCCSALFFSCEENVNPFEEYQEHNVFNCILRGDTLLQVATVAKTFTTGGFNPYANSNDPFISSADVRVWYKDSVYHFYDSTITRLDTSRYKSPMNIYINRRFKIEANEPVQVEVMMPDGRRLKSSTRTAGRVTFDDSSTIFIYGDLEFVNIRWVSPDIGSNYFLPNFSIIYFKKVGNQYIKYKKQVPFKYENNQPIPFIVSKMPLINIDMNTIKQALREISNGVSDKSSIYIPQHPEFLVGAFDDALSKYYSNSTETFSSLSVTLDETDYSNIQGGYGIFASFTSTEYMQLKFSRDFITSFGYTVKEK